MNKIKVLVVRPMLQPEVVEVKNTLDAMQNIVGGDLEQVTLEDGLIIMCDKEGRYKNYNHCCLVDDVEFVGTVFITHFDEEDAGKLRSLTDREIVSLKFGRRIQR